MTEERTTLEDLKGALGNDGAAAEAAVQAEPKIDAQGRSYATGRRKDAIARVWVKPGSGRIVINGKEFERYFARPVLRMVINQPLTVAGRENQFDIMATVTGGGWWRRAGWWLDAHRNHRRRLLWVYSERRTWRGLLRNMDCGGWRHLRSKRCASVRRAFFQRLRANRSARCDVLR